jgi:hypothetical protein
VAIMATFMALKFVSFDLSVALSFLAKHTNS